MAYRRNLTTRAKIFAQQQFTPSISHLNHNEDRKNQHSDEKLNSFLQSRSYGVYSNHTNTLLGLGFSCGNAGVSFRDSKWSQFRHEPITTRNKFLLARNMSTTIADVLADKTMEVVSNQAAPVVSEVAVAVAVADSSFPVAALQYAIDGIHIFTGLNWWASIVITTLIIRTLLLPSMINELKAATNIYILFINRLAIKKKMNDKVSVAEVFEAMESAVTESGVGMSKLNNWLFIRGTFVVSYYLAIQNMVEKVPTFQTGGASWFLDLTSADSFYILPCLNAYAFWIFSECYLPAGKIKNVARFLVALSIPFLASFPQALLCHWITSNLFFLVYKLTMKQEPVKKFFNIPIITPPPPPSPASESEPASESKSNSSD